MDTLDLEQDIAEQKQRKQKRKEEGNLEALEGDLDTELFLLTRPKKARATAQCSSRGYVHNTSIRTISNKVSTRLKQSAKIVPTARKSVGVSRPVDTDVPAGMCMVISLLYSSGSLG